MKNKKEQQRTNLMDSEFNKLEAEFGDDNDLLDAPIGSGGKKPKVKRWMIRAAISLVSAVVLMVILKPKMCLQVKYNIQKNSCETSTKWSKLILLSVITAVVIYFGLQKYY